MDVLVKIAQLLVSLSILIVLHELGHYTLARIFKVRVEKFYLFFDAGFSLFKKKIGDTEYGIGWLPLGGYVKISGMIDESMDREAMKQPPKPYEFRSKKAWQRLLIMLGGVIVNFLLALFIYILVFFKWGEEYVPVDRLIYGYSFEQEFQDLGLENGDKILALDGEVVDRWISIHHDIVVNDPRVIQVERDGKIMDIQIPEGMTSTLLKLQYVMEPRVPCEVDGMAKDGGMALAGVELNDRIIGVNDTPIQFYDEFKDMTRKEINTSFDLSILRGTDTIQVQASTNEDGMFGFSRKLYYDFYETVVVKYSFIQSIPAGINRGFEITGSYLKQLKMLFKPETKAYEELGGFIKIGSIFPSTWNWERFWNMTAFLSIILAIMNVLPIPALDGGHVMFLMFEIITGRKPGDKFMEYAQIVGMILLLSLLLYANLNDIIGLFKN
ncbi:MAG: RIP metalloprotease RseP [Bacteroidetes bacterium]|nr:MAG: RIP metalloprotease RseP [Bacteroidota bacterium]RLD72552.1 MAG: RIP metalloprotease RseP [Bacteroidota bacterium]RLD94943.1 MAG: RIP metalloprotease RseP [Bacteroidota bacterium]RLE03524.1 MAG: RIP metalloprotease RseP [Bacteroidota bacterium]